MWLEFDLLDRIQEGSAPWAGCNDRPSGKDHPVRRVDRHLLLVGVELEHLFTTPERSTCGDTLADESTDGVFRTERACILFEEAGRTLRCMECRPSTPDFVGTEQLVLQVMLLRGQERTCHDLAVFRSDPCPTGRDEDSFRVASVEFYPEITCVPCERDVVRVFEVGDAEDP